MPYRDHTKKSDSVKHWTGLFFDIDSFFRCGGFVAAVSWRQGVGRRSLSVAAYCRVLRTLGGKNLGKCRLRAHQHPLLPPLPNLRRTRPMQTSKARRVFNA